MNNNVKHNEPLEGGLLNNVLYFDEYLIGMRKYAVENHVPIIKDDGLVFLSQLIKIKNAKEVLEIGTAIAYSSSIFALINKDIKVDTIERDEKMYQEACKNIKALGIESQVNLIYADALEVDLSMLKIDEYDLIFIDAAKSQYTKFFQKFETKLKKGGIIFSDNLLFHGLVENATGKESRNLNQMLRKIRSYNEWLSENEAYDTTFLRIGDGIALSIKK